MTPMQQSTFAQKTTNGWQWHFKRNCSISPRQLICIFGALALISLLIGGVFFFLGAFLVLPFSLLEILVLSIAFYYNAIHAVDYERLKVENNHIIVEQKAGLKETEIALAREFTRVKQLEGKKDLIELIQGEKKALFGHHIHPNYRAKLMKELVSRL
jgi:uncharacterized membrane protein